VAEAERLAAEAVEIATPTDVLSMRADAHLDQAAVAATVGHPDQSRQAAEAALALYQAKGNRPGAVRAEAACQLSPR
jgi:hypothetical protein